MNIASFQTNYINVRTKKLIEKFSHSFASLDVYLVASVPITKVIIYDDDKNIIKDVAGPFNEDSWVNLTCQSDRGEFRSKIFFHLLDVKNRFFVTFLTVFDSFRKPACSSDLVERK